MLLVNFINTTAYKNVSYNTRERNGSVRPNCIGFHAIFYMEQISTKNLVPEGLNTSIICFIYVYSIIYNCSVKAIEMWKPLSQLNCLS